MLLSFAPPFLQYGLAPKKLKTVDGYDLPEGISFGNAGLEERFRKGDEVVLKAHMSGKKHPQAELHTLWNDWEEEFIEAFHEPQEDVIKQFCFGLMHACNVDKHELHEDDLGDPKADL